MPDHDIEMITSVQLHAALRKSLKHFIILDCRSSHEYTESHIRTAVNFSIPSIMLRRFAAGKIDITSTIKCRDLKERILSCYKESTFVLYNNSNEPVGEGGGGAREDLSLLAGGGGGGGGVGGCSGGNDTTINVLHRKLKQDGCRVVCLEGWDKNRYSTPASFQAGIGTMSYGIKCSIMATKNKNKKKLSNYHIQTFTRTTFVLAPDSIHSYRFSAIHSPLVRHLCALPFMPAR
uniref:Rhodanese domain-containing protein n=1 Tax=Anopheles farauti TaxID=69004 RepID=A0A182Q9X9_9DIPT